MFIGLTIFLYVLTAAVAAPLKFKQVNRKNGHDSGCGCDDCFWSPALFAAFWIVAIPQHFILSIIGMFDTESRQEKELRAARHKADLAEEQAREMRALERAGGL